MPMIKTSTKNDLILSLYGENLCVNKPLDGESEELDEFSEMLQIKEQLDDFIIPAPQRVVTKILAFAKQSDLESA